MVKRAAAHDEDLDDAEARKRDFIEGQREARAEKEEEERLEEEAKLAAMDAEQREAYLAEKAEKELHENRKAKMLTKSMKGYGATSARGILKKKRGRKKK